VTWDDFNGSGWMGQREASVGFAGKSWEWVGFYDFLTDPKNIDVSSKAIGTPSAILAQGTLLGHWSVWDKP
jgi:hypothetical protein